MAALPLVAVAPSAPLLAGVVFVAGAADAVADVGMNALGVRVEQAREQSIMNRLHALWSLGSVGGSAVSAGALAAGVELPAQLLAVAVGGAGAVVVASRLVPDPEPRPRPRPRLGSVAGLIAAGVAIAIVEGAPVDWSAIYLTDTLEASATVASAAFVVYMAGMLGGRAGGDAVVDRLGVRRSILVGLGVTAAGTALVMSRWSAVAVLAGFGVWGLGVSVMAPLFYRLAGAHTQFGEGSGLAALTVGNRLGFLAGPATVGTLAASIGLSWAILAVVGVGLAGVTISMSGPFGR